MPNGKNQTHGTRTLLAARAHEIERQSIEVERRLHLQGAEMAVSRLFMRAAELPRPT